MRLNEAGQIVTAEGLAVLDSNDRPIFVAPNESRIEIARDGTVSTENGAIGWLRVVKFAPDPQEDVQPVVAGLCTTPSNSPRTWRPRMFCKAPWRNRMSSRSSRSPT